MVKKLDILIVRSFVGPFVVTFFVTLFVLVMQFFWLYMDDLIGKGLGMGLIGKLLFLMSPTMVPLALPLSILLASIMTFGNMGENFELVAIKSAGISLLRFMRPLLIFITFVGGLAFLFSNNVTPVANLKALSLLYDLRSAKPTLNIRPDQFNNEIQGFSIRVGSKDKDDHTIRDIVIYDQTAGVNTTVTLAKQGEMLSSPDKQFLIFKLTDGCRYDEEYSNGRLSHNQTRMYFKKWDKVFDLSSFRLSHTNQDLFKGANQMMNVHQLGMEIDSIKRSGKRISSNVSAYLSPYITWLNPGKDKDTLMKRMTLTTAPAAIGKYDTSFAQLVPDTVRSRVLETTLNNVRNAKGMIDVTAIDKKIQTKNYLDDEVEWHRKFTLSFACILLFLIGAPLGAIIRKGGLGMPLVIAVSFFVIFHITSIVGEKLAKAGTMQPWMGMWMATAMLLPISFILINAARKDSQVFSKEWYIRSWRRFKALLPIKNQ